MLRPERDWAIARACTSYSISGIVKINSEKMLCFFSIKIFLKISFMSKYGFTFMIDILFFLIQQFAAYVQNLYLSLFKLYS